MNIEWIRIKNFKLCKGIDRVNYVFISNKKGPEVAWNGKLFGFKEFKQKFNQYDVECVVCGECLSWNEFDYTWFDDGPQTDRKCRKCKAVAAKRGQHLNRLKKRREKKCRTKARSLRGPVQWLR